MNPTIRAQRGIFEKQPGSNDWSIRYTDGSGRYRREHVGPFSLAQKLLSKRRAEALQGRKLPETLRRKFVSFGEIANDALVYPRPTSAATEMTYRGCRSSRNGGEIVTPNH